MLVQNSPYYFIARPQFCRVRYFVTSVRSLLGSSKLTIDGLSVIFRGIGLKGVTTYIF